MPQFSANLSFLFKEFEFSQRFDEAKKNGFNNVEFLFPYDYSPNKIRQWLNKNNLRQILFNAYPGNWEKGERGIASIPGREEEFAKYIEIALEYAKTLKCFNLHVMAGIISITTNYQDAHNTYIHNLKHAAIEAAKIGVNILIEPINPYDMPGYFLKDVNQAINTIKELNLSNARLLCDVYHIQMTSGRVTETLKKAIKYTQHIQISNVPNRSEPNIGELNYNYIIQYIDKLNYKGFIGCEYHPQKETLKGLEWLDDYS